MSTQRPSAEFRRVVPVTTDIRLTGPWPQDLLDREAVEQARLVYNANLVLLDSCPSVDVGAVARGRGSTLRAASAWLLRQRRAHRLIAVAGTRGKLAIPAFQLDEGSARVRGDVAAVNVELLGVLGLTPWGAWHWWLTPNGWLDDAPVDALPSCEIQQLLGAARELAAAE